MAASGSEPTYHMNRQDKNNGSSKAEYDAYQVAYEKWKNPPKPSARRKLEEKKVESKSRDAARNKTKNKNHNVSYDDD